MLDLEKLQEVEKYFPRLGDIVILNSGGPNMLVVKNNDRSVKCLWVDARGRTRKASFPYECVTKMSVELIK